MDQIGSVKVSVIVPVIERSENTLATLPEYEAAIEEITPNYELIYICNGYDLNIIDALKLEARHRDHLSVLSLSRNFGEAAAIEAGFSQANGELIFILPPYKQIQCAEFRKLFDAIGESDLVLGKRWPRVDTPVNRLQTLFFNRLLNMFADDNYSDIGCGVRLMKREVLEQTQIYGDQHRFLPLLATQAGFTFTEVEVAQAHEDSHQRVYSPGIYARRVLDLLTVVFLTKFNRKPLRFFGLIGFSLGVIGLIGISYMGFERLVLGMPIADRPLLIFFSLFLVLGLQLVALGLVGETVIFVQSRKNKEYRIKEVVKKKRC